MDVFAAIMLLAGIVTSIAVFRVLLSQHKQAKQTALDLFLPILDSHITNWIELVADGRLDTTTSRRKAKEQGIDHRMMYVMDLSEEILRSHGHDIDVDEIYARAQGLYESLRSDPRSALNKQAEAPDAV